MERVEDGLEGPKTGEDTPVASQEGAVEPQRHHHLHHRISRRPVRGGVGLADLRPAVVEPPGGAAAQQAAEQRLQELGQSVRWLYGVPTATPARLSLRVVRPRP